MLYDLLAVYVLGILTAFAGLWVWYQYGDVKRSRDTLPSDWKPTKR